MSKPAAKKISESSLYTFSRLSRATLHVEGCPLRRVLQQGFGRSFLRKTAVTGAMSGSRAEDTCCFSFAGRSGGWIIYTLRLVRCVKFTRAGGTTVVFFTLTNRDLYPVICNITTWLPVQYVVYRTGQDQRSIYKATTRGCLHIKIQYLPFLPLEEKETNFRGHKLLTQLKVQGQKSKKKTEKLPTLAKKYGTSSEKQKAG